MRKIWIFIGLVALLAMPATAMAKPSSADKRNASKECRAERAAMGAANFKALHGNLGKCVSKTAREEQRERKAARKAAVKECKAANKRGRALAACVSKQSKANKGAADAEDRAERNAAKTCRAEQTSLGNEVFRAKYGTNRNKSNAFGKCVSAASSDDEDETVVEQPVEQPAEQPAA